MPQNYFYTNPIPNSAMASHGLAWRNSVTKGSDAKPGFGSRHYCLGVDPLVVKFLGTSPYIYVSGNLASNIDCNGNFVVKGSDKEKEMKMAEQISLGYNFNSKYDNLVSRLKQEKPLK